MIHERPARVSPLPGLNKWRVVQVRSLVEVLPFIDVVEGDPFNSSPTDPKIMGPDALQRFEAGEAMPSVRIRTPLVELPLGATEDRICGASARLLPAVRPPPRQSLRIPSESCGLE